MLWGGPVAFKSKTRRKHKDVYSIPDEDYIMEFPESTGEVKVDYGLSAKFLTMMGVPGNMAERSVKESRPRTVGMGMTGGTGSRSTKMRTLRSLKRLKKSTNGLGAGAGAGVLGLKKGSGVTEAGGMQDMGIGVPTSPIRTPRGAGEGGRSPIGSPEGGPADFRLTTGDGFIGGGRGGGGGKVLSPLLSRSMTAGALRAAGGLGAVDRPMTSSQKIQKRAIKRLQKAEKVQTLENTAFVNKDLLGHSLGGKKASITFVKREKPRKERVEFK
jgi:hypothetical protein